MAQWHSTRSTATQVVLLILRSLVPSIVTIDASHKTVTSILYKGVPCRTVPDQQQGHRTSACLDDWEIPGETEHGGSPLLRATPGCMDDSSVALTPPLTTVQTRRQSCVDKTKDSRTTRCAHRKYQMLWQERIAQAVAEVLYKHDWISAHQRSHLAVCFCTAALNTLCALRCRSTLDS